MADEQPRSLSEQRVSLFNDFVRSGNPNGGGIRNGDSYTAQDGKTMILNDTCTLFNTPGCQS